MECSCDPEFATMETRSLQGSVALTTHCPLELPRIWKKEAQSRVAVVGSIKLSAMTSLSVFRDIVPAQKLEGSLLKIYKQDDYPNKMFLAYRGRSPSFQGLRFSAHFDCL